MSKTLISGFLFALVLWALLLSPASSSAQEEGGLAPAICEGDVPPEYLRYCTDLSNRDVPGTIPGTNPAPCPCSQAARHFIPGTGQKRPLIRCKREERLACAGASRRQ